MQQEQYYAEKYCSTCRSTTVHRVTITSETVYVVREVTRCMKCQNAKVKEPNGTTRQ